MDFKEETETKKKSNNLTHATAFYCVWCDCVCMGLEAVFALILSYPIYL